MIKSWFLGWLAVGGFAGMSPAYYVGGVIVGAAFSAITYFGDGAPISTDNLIQLYKGLILKHTTLTAEDQQVVDLVYSKLVTAYSSLPEDEMSSYSNDLQEVVSNSSVSATVKETVLSTAVFISNSVQCAR